MTNSLKCSNCGASQRKAVQFCEWCGTALPRPQPPPQRPMPPPSNFGMHQGGFNNMGGFGHHNPHGFDNSNHHNDFHHTPRRNRRGGGIIGAIVSVVFVVIFISIFFPVCSSFGFFACGDSGSSSSPFTGTVYSVSIYGGDRVLSHNQPLTLQALIVVSPNTAANRRIAWRSSNTGVVNITDHGDIQHRGCRHLSYNPNNGTVLPCTLHLAKM